MQQPCKNCGYESPEIDKFCRQCGEPQLTESEFSSATTLNHGKPEPAPPYMSAGTERLTPSVGDVIAGKTERYYYPPPYAPPYAPPPVNLGPPQVIPQATEAHKAGSSWGRALVSFFKGLALFILFLGLLAATASSVFFSQEADRERARRQELENKNRGREGVENANGRAEVAWRQMLEAIRLIHDASEQAVGAGATLAIPVDKSIDLSKFDYPGARVEAMLGSYGNEARSLTTRNGFDSVREFYEKQFGKPVIQVREGEGRQKMLFQSSGTPSVLIRIEQVDNEGERVKITILRALLRFPKVE
ncbi:MAG TPA: zinc ribbon domain-containing protein [Blastocatellia bacterium]|nr:zinc ribbon domain-containing protein [Blastocatellia bacterium]